MLYAIICEDRPDAGTLRGDTRPVHLEYLASLGATVKFAGPFLSAEGAPEGSLLMVEAESEAAARAIADGDPYAKAGLFSKVSVRAWRWVVNAPQG